MSTVSDLPMASGLRLLSYNVRALRSDVAALIRVIRRLRPDVLAVQEAPTWPGWRARCIELARRCGLLYVAGGRDAGGNLLMVAPRVAVTNARALRTPEPWLEPIRGMITAVLRWGQHRIGLVGTHLGLRREGRKRQVARVLAELRTFFGMPTVLLGDLNERPNGPSWRQFATAGLVDPGVHGAAGGFGGATFPARHPTKRIDAILASHDVGVKEYRVPDEPEIRTDLMRATDHLPVLATVEL